MLPQDSLERLRASSTKRLLVGLSGGVDSVSLLHALVSASADGSIGAGKPVAALHVNHGLQKAAGDFEACCRSVCESWSVPLTLRRVTVDPSGSVETRARTARYGAFRDEVREGDLLLLAHHADDQVETALFRLFRGSRLPGLQGMPRERKLGRGTLYRPLLDTPRAGIESYAARHQLPFVEDAANADLTHDRNWLRHELIPALRRRWPGVKETILETIGRDEAWRREQVARRRRDLAGILASDHSLRLDGLRDIAARDRQAAGQVIDVWLMDLELPLPSAAALEQIVSRQIVDRLPANPSGVVRSGDMEFRCHNGLLHVLRRLPAPCEGQRMPPFAEGKASLPWGEIVSEVAAGKGLKRGLPYEFALRAGGEKIRRGRARTLKNLLRETNVPHWLRDRVPLVALGGEIVGIAAVPAWGVPMLVADGYGVAADEAGTEVSFLPGDRL